MQTNLLVDHVFLFLPPDSYRPSARWGRPGHRDLHLQVIVGYVVWGHPWRKPASGKVNPRRILSQVRCGRCRDHSGGRMVDELTWAVSATLPRDELIYAAELPWKSKYLNYHQIPD